MNSSDKQNIWVLIQRYVVGTATNSEKKEVEKWAAKSKNNREILEQVSHIWANTPEEEFHVNVEEAWTQFKTGKLQKEHKQTRLYTLTDLSSDFQYFVRIAAILLLSLALGVLVVTQLPEEQTPPESEQIVMQDIQTEIGGKAEVTFSDGSKVMLNSATQLRFPEEFKQSIREVHLDGQAYFEVEHDPNRPFVVYNNGVKVKVLGTEFDVRGWQEDKNVKVVVRSGKVAVNRQTNLNQQMSSYNPDREKAILTKGMMAEVEVEMEDEGSIKTIPSVDIREHLVWMSGGLYFENTPFRQVIKDIERRFKVDIEVKVNDPNHNPENELMDTPFTSTFYDAGLDEVLEVLSASMKLDINRNGKSITFHKSS